MGLFSSDDRKPSEPSSAFSPPPSAEPPSLKTPLIKTTSNYDDQDFSKFTNQVRDSDGLHEDGPVQQINTTRGYDWTMNLHPRLRNCIGSMKTGFKMGAAIGGCFGVLTGVYTAVAQRQILMIPVCIIGGSCSFGFMLSCGMIIRCEEELFEPIEPRRGRPDRCAYSHRDGLIRRYIPE